jgi:hypothetical protein
MRQPYQPKGMMFMCPKMGVEFEFWKSLITHKKVPKIESISTSINMQGPERTSHLTRAILSNDPMSSRLKWNLRCRYVQLDSSHLGHVLKTIRTKLELCSRPILFFTYRDWMCNSKRLGLEIWNNPKLPYDNEKTPKSEWSGWQFDQRLRTRKR